MSCNGEKAVSQAERSCLGRFKSEDLMRSPLSREDQEQGDESYDKHAIFLPMRCDL